MRDEGALFGVGMAFTRFNGEGEIVDTSDIMPKIEPKICWLVEMDKRYRAALAERDWRGLMILANKYEDTGRAPCLAAQIKADAVNIAPECAEARRIFAEFDERVKGRDPSLFVARNTTPELREQVRRSKDAKRKREYKERKRLGLPKLKTGPKGGRHGS